jgi:O-glycosyl hydrolase
MKRLLPTLLLLASTVGATLGQARDFTAVAATVDFSRHVRPWDGFGFNYVETAHTGDYAAFPQEYGGFSLLDEAEQQEIIDLVFGEDGLKVGLVKMFFGPLHQEEPGGPFDHARVTANMRAFVAAGLQTTRARGDDLTIMTTLYGPPAYATLQRFVRGRDLDPAHKRDVARYMISWVKYLRDEAGLPVRYLSLHNEGEDWERWPADGSDRGWKGHDYNLYWPPDQVVDFLRFMRPMLDAEGLQDVGLTPGETSNWFRFAHWGYAHAIADDPEALAHLGLITSHGFWSADFNRRWYGDHESLGTDVLRAERPELHAWVTSTSWSQMDVNFIREIYGSIYSAKVNGLIPWAGIQRPPHWVEGDPNPGNAIQVSEDGTYEVRRGYYFYKQVSRAGQPGMAVAHTTSHDANVNLIAFAQGGTRHPDAFAVINTSSDEKPVEITLAGSSHTQFDAFRTADEGDRYTPLGTFAPEAGRLFYTAPPRSVTTFFGQD